MNNIKFEVIKKITETNFRYKNLRNISKIDSNSPPSVFVGSGLKYPLVNVGILSPLDHDDNAWLYDNEKYWAKNNFGIKDVVNLRNSLLNSRFQSQVQDSRSKKKFIELAKEIALSAKPVDLEIQLKNKLDLKKNKDRIITPHGMRANLKEAKLTGNVKIDQKVDRVINDDIKASEGINVLYKNNLSEYYLNKILSIGVLGLQKNKKLVPTRWSITATDDTITKNLLKEIKDYKEIEDYELFIGEFLGNQYLVMFFPQIFNFELFELYLPNSSWNPSTEIKASTDFEDFHGRKNYASNTGGGYYATRLPIIEYLKKERRQASVLAIRLETPSYWAALGVWVVRESVRKALSNRKIKFDSKEELLNSAKNISKTLFNFDLSQILNQSKILKNIRTQKTLKNWF